MVLEETHHPEQDICRIHVFVEDRCRAAGRILLTEVVRKARLTGLEVHEIRERRERGRVGHQLAALGDGAAARPEAPHHVRREPIEEHEDGSRLRLLVGGLEIVEEARGRCDVNGAAVQGDVARWRVDEACLGHE
jgi:hypothetical protein